jgi:hypothetical protein
MIQLIGVPFISIVPMVSVPPSYLTLFPFLNERINEYETATTLIGERTNQSLTRPTRRTVALIQLSCIGLFKGRKKREKIPGR